MPETFTETLCTVALPASIHRLPLVLRAGGSPPALNCPPAAAERRTAQPLTRPAREGYPGRFREGCCYLVNGIGPEY